MSKIGSEEGKFAPRITSYNVCYTKLLRDNHTYIKITNATGESNEKTYVYEFTTDGTTSYVPSADEVVIPVDMQTGVVSTLDAVEKFQDAIYNSIPSGGRFSVDGTTIAIEQSAVITSYSIHYTKLYDYL